MVVCFGGFVWFGGVFLVVRVLRFCWFGIFGLVGWGGVWVWFWFSPSNLLWEGTGGKESSSDEWDVSVSASLLKPLPFR